MSFQDRAQHQIGQIDKEVRCVYLLHSRSRASLFGRCTLLYPLADQR